MARFPKFGRKKAYSKSQTHFQEILESAASLKSSEGKKVKLFSPECLVGGFYTADLIRIFNALCEKRRLKYEAASIWSVYDEKDPRTFRDLINAIIASGCALIVQTFGTSHFVLIYSVDDDGDFLVKDSGHNEKYRLEELNRAPGSDDCVIIGPQSSLIFQQRNQ